MEVEDVLKYGELIKRIAREECMRHGMKEMIEDAIQEGYLALIESKDLPTERKTEVIRAKIKRMLSQERREKYIKDQLRSLGYPTSSLKADVLSEAEFLLQERGIVIVDELLRRLSEVGITPPARSTLYRWLREWSKERRLKVASGYVPHQ